MAVRTSCTEANILRELEEITSLYNFGLQLGIDSKVLDRIDKDHRNDTEQQRSKIVTYWYRNTAESERTWGRVADAIGRLGDHRNLETRLRKLPTAITVTGPPPSTGDSNGVAKEEAPFTVTNQTAPASKKTLSFSDNLSPHDLVEWLSQELEKRSLSLNQQLKDKLVEEEINGAAFKDLSIEELEKMGFKTGPRKNIITIIQTCTVTLEEKGNKRMKLTDAEERVEHDDKTDPDVPHVLLCTMEFTPEMESLPAASVASAGRGFAPAALPYKNRLWRKKVLKVLIKNRHLLSRWGIKLTKFMECANRWSDGAVSKGSNHIPRFETDDEDPDIVVELNENGDNQSTIGCVEGEGPTQVYLDLSYPDKKYQEHLIVHELGHALGLGHEHQRSDFWSWIKDYVDEKMMQRDLGGRFIDWQCKDGLMDGGATPYDSGSVMHYWCKKSWLTKGYNNKEYLDKQSKFLSEGLKQALYGIHERDGNVVTEPSRVDLDFLSAEYNEVQPGKQSAKLESTKKEEAGRSDSRTVPDSEETDHDNGAMAHGPSPQTDIILTINDLDDVLEALWGARARWNDIGRKIGVDTGTLATMKGSDNDCLRDTLTHWLRGVYDPDEQNSRPRTWRSLIEALRAKTVNFAAMANELEIKRKVSRH